VIALTHMRNPNDVKLAENVDEIDLILGGHDHVYEVNQVSKCRQIFYWMSFKSVSLKRERKMIVGSEVVKLSGLLSCLCIFKTLYLHIT
jgi:5''-nucleotidase/2'',3''-cyclic phosphodiesterase and related esterases